MKKIILFFIMFIFYINIANANWYGWAWQDKTIWDWTTWCSTDWDTTWWSPQFSGAPLSWNYNYDSKVISESGNWMFCEFWDWANPTVWYQLSWWTTNNNTWTNSNVTSSISCNDTWWSWCDSNSYQYRKSSSFFNCDSWWSWNNGWSYNHSTPNNTNLIEYICFRAKDKAWNWYVYSQVATIKIDKILPKVWNPLDPWDIINSTPINLLANNNYNYYFSVWVNWWGNITTIEWIREKANNENIDLLYSCSSSPCNVSWDISKVDNFRQTNWWREYSFRITKICDEAWNCWTWNKNFNHNVYANSTTMTNDWTFNYAKKEITTNELSINNIADWSNKNLSITLKDKYWNAIIPAFWINRTIDFNWNIQNTMFLNQQKRNWGSSVYVNKTTNPANFFNNILNSWNNSFNSEISTNWIYTYTFKVYTPTSNQDNWPVSDTLAKFDINGLTFDVNWSIWSITNSSISWTHIVSKFSPLYYSYISWEIKSEWIAEWWVQNSKISITKNWSTSTLSEKLQLSYSWIDSSKFNMYGWSLTTTTTINNSPWNMIDSPTFPSLDNSLKTKLVQKPWVTLNLNNLYLATHITYNITWPNWWTIIPVYNSDIIWKRSYFDWDQYIAHQSSLKVLWQVRTDSKQSLTIDQFSSDVKIVWNVDKFTSKTQIISNAWNFAKGKPISDVNTSSKININWTTINWILYYWWISLWSTQTFTLWNWSNISVNGKKTILAIWWNIYIKNNLYYADNNSILWIIALKDKNWNWWNIYIDPSVTNIVWTLFAEKSIIWYNWTNEIDWSTEIKILKNQLHIYWNVFSENTIWWSRESTPRCPYFIWSCDLEIAQKYDLNYLRRYYLIPDWIYKKPANGWKAIWWWTYSWNWNINWWNTLFARNITNTITQLYVWNSVLIEYNPIIQKIPPPLFEIKN